MQNCGVRFSDDLKAFPEKIPPFCILHSAFCIFIPPLDIFPQLLYNVVNAKQIRLRGAGWIRLRVSLLALTREPDTANTVGGKDRNTNFGIALHPNDGFAVRFFRLEVFSMNNSHRKVRMLTEGALCIALAEILSFLPLYKMPWGGSVDLAMPPIILFCVRWGFGQGMVVAFAHAVFQTLFEGGIAIGWQSIIGDFILAYTVLGLAGLFKGKYVPATIVACVARFLIHYVVGATIWAEYMPETFFNMTMTTPWFYSALYNGAYMLPDMVILLVIGVILMKTPAKKYVLGEDLT